MAVKKRVGTRKVGKGAAKQAEEAPEDDATTGAAVEDDGNGNAKAEEPTETKQENEPATEEKAPKKRKKAASTDEPQKAPRRSGRSATKSQPLQEQLLQFMLSKDAEELCRPNDETEDIKSRGDIRTYSSSVLNPFEELLCAVILSRPISHRLGLRTIRTVLNDPYNFTSARAIKDAGPEKVHQAVWDARTQHKDKTAAEISQIAEVVLDKFTAAEDEDGTQLEKVREDCSHDPEKEREYIKSSIKGVGKTGMDIFFRRVQWLWEATYPFMDDRTRQSLRKLGLPEEGEELVELINQCWKKLETSLAGDDEATKKRRAFTTILERATGSDLERKLEPLLKAAAAA